VQGGPAPTISTLNPDDSISMRGYQTRRRGDAASSRGHLEQSEGEDPSVVSFHSSVDGYLFKTLHGRAFSNQSDMYLLPADDEEHSRLDIQHSLLRVFLDGLYTTKEVVEHALRQDQSHTPAILDIGTGSGRWAVEMAQRFPYVDVVGLDLVPPALLSTESIPPNCRFEVDDANLSMDHYRNTFDLVHCRSTQVGIVDFESFLYEVARTLRPGGVLLLIAAGTRVYGEDHQPLPTKAPGEPGFSWLEYLYTVTVNVYLARGNESISAGNHWNGWLEQNPNYRDLVMQEFFIPLGPWPPNLSARETKASEMMREDIMQFMEAFRVSLLSAGWEAGEIDRCIQNARQEMRELRVHAYIQWQYTTAIRTDDDWHERLERPMPIA